MVKRFINLISLLVVIIILAGCGDNETEAANSGKIVSGSLDDMYSNMEVHGNECKEIDDVKERGDCFRTTNEKYLKWTVDIRDEHFFYNSWLIPEPDSYDDILIYSIDESDNLVNMQETDSLDEFMENNSETKLNNAKEGLEDNWYVFSNFFPREYREDLKTITLSRKESFGLAASGSESNPSETILKTDMYITKYIPELKYAHIHEFGHILTLDKDQINTNLSKEECATYYALTCMNEDSYLNLFYQEFWTDLSSDYEHVDLSTGENHEEFYLTYQDHFFNAYQANGPEEDIADNFTFFIMMDPEELDGQTDPRYEKVMFFYQFDELVSLRTQILENIFDLTVKDKKLY